MEVRSASEFDTTEEYIEHCHKFAEMVVVELVKMDSRKGPDDFISEEEYNAYVKELAKKAFLKINKENENT